MKFAHSIVVCLLLITLTSVTSFAAAQENGSPLLDMLSLVPDQPHDNLYFIDYAAIAAAYPPARIPVDTAEYQTIVDAPDRFAPELEPLYIWWSVFYRLGFPVDGYPLEDYFEAIAASPTETGLDFFSTQQWLVEAGEDRQTLYVRGALDESAIRAVHEGRGYTQQALDGMELWCANDCAEVQTTAVDPAHLFGGAVGQAWPFVLTDDQIVSSSDSSFVPLIAENETGEHASLADDPTLQQVIAAASAEGVILQALLFGANGMQMLADPVASLAGNNESARSSINDIIRVYLDNGFQTLPAYQRLFMADIVSDTETIFELNMVYESRLDALLATAILNERLNTSNSRSFRRPFMAVMDAADIQSAQLEALPLGDQFVVRLRLSAPKSTADDLRARDQSSLNTTFNTAAPSYIYSTFLRLIRTQDMFWFSIVTREDLEARIGD